MSVSVSVGSASASRKRRWSPLAARAPALAKRARLNGPGGAATAIVPAGAEPAGPTISTSAGAGSRARSEASRRSAGAAPANGTMTLTFAAGPPSRGARIARCGMVGWGTARAATPRRSRWALTARACSSGTPDFSSAPAAMLPGIARQW